MRAFVAIDFSPELKSQIAELQRSLRPLARSGRWKYVDNFHLTLKFLDEISDRQKTEIDRILKEASAGCRAFRLRMDRMGSFPGREAVRVLWLGLGGELQALGEMQADLDRRLEAIGFAREKRGYTPHVTIGQDLVFQNGYDPVRKVMDFGHFPEIRVDRLVLFKSEQLAGKRVYTPVKEYIFLGKRSSL